MRGYHISFSAYIFQLFSIWSCHFPHFGVDLIVTVSRGTLWTCIGSCEKLFLLCFSSELLGLEGAPAWVRSRWRSVGLLNAKWRMWHVGEKAIKKQQCVRGRWRLCSGWIWLQLGWLPGGDWSPVGASSRLQTRGCQQQKLGCQSQKMTLVTFLLSCY